MAPCNLLTKCGKLVLGNKFAISLELVYNIDLRHNSKLAQQDSRKSKRRIKTTNFV